MSKEAFRNQSDVKFKEFVDNETEQVKVRNTENVDIQVQADNESLVISYVEHEEALDKIKILDNSTDTTGETTKFIHFALQRLKVNLIDVKNVWTKQNV